jgi:VWFA-related protein
MRVRAARPGLPLVALVAACRLLAQTPPAPAQKAAELTSRDAPATFTTKVNLVMVPVVVRDAKGKAVGTLQKDDFALFDKGKPQAITRFSVQRAGESVIPAEGATQVANDAAVIDAAGAAPEKPAGPIAQRFVAYLFDDVHTTNSDLIVARNAADRHLATSLDATTRAAILTTSGQGNVDFTGDRAKLHEALMRLMAHPTLGGAGSECPDITYYWADLIADKHDQSALQAAVTMTMGNCTPAPENNSQQAVQEAIQMATRAAQATAGQILEKGERDTRLAFVTIENAIRRLSAAPGERTLIFVSGGFYFADYLRLEESQIMDRAIRASVRISSLNARGLYVLIPGGDASTPAPFGGPAALNAAQQYQ